MFRRISISLVALHHRARDVGGAKAKRFLLLFSKSNFFICLGRLPVILLRMRSDRTGVASEVGRAKLNAFLLIIIEDSIITICVIITNLPT